jgi:hypothetical protein
MLVYQWTVAGVLLTGGTTVWETLFLAPLYVIQVSVWCAMNAKRIIAPIFYAERCPLTTI